METPYALIAAVYTPVTRQGELQLEGVARQARWLVRTGASGAFIAGTTGECHSLSLDQRRRLTERWVEAARDTDLEAIVHVGDNCLENAQSLAAHAQQVGADAISAMAPSYFKPAGVAELIDFCEQIAAQAPDLPFYYYHIPPMTGVDVPMPEFLVEAKPRIPNLRGLKYSSNDLVQLQECLRVEDGTFDVLFGCDEMLLAAVALGIRGAVGSTYNFAAPLYRQMLAAVEQGDRETARELQWQSVQLVRLLSGGPGFLSSSKRYMSLLGIDCGSVLPPLRDLTPSEYKQLQASLPRLQELGMLDLDGVTAS